MIAKVSSGRSFTGLAAYLVAGRDGATTDRIAWRASHHLMTDDPMTAASIMEATAAENARTQEPVYHLTIAFHPDDAVTPEMMQRAADRVLAALHLDEHQALMIAHGDRPHPHVHVMINRVHPETFATWDRWRDFVTIDRTIRSLERELDLHPVAEPSPSRDHGAPDRGHRASDADPSRGDRRDGSDDGPRQTRGWRYADAERGADPAADAAEAARDYHRARDAQDASANARDAARHAEDAERRWREIVARAEVAMARFTTALSQLYEDSHEVARRFFQRAGHMDYERTRRLFVDEPETIGVLRSDRSIPDLPLRARVAARATEAHEAVRAYHERWLAHGGTRSIASAAAEIHARVAAGRARLERASRDDSGSPAEYSRQLKSALRRATPRDLDRLRHLLGPAEWALVRRVAYRLARPLLGHDEAER